MVILMRKIQWNILVMILVKRPENGGDRLVRKRTLGICRPHILVLIKKNSMHLSSQSHTWLCTITYNFLSLSFSFSLNNLEPRKFSGEFIKLLYEYNIMPSLRLFFTFVLTFCLLNMPRSIEAVCLSN